MILVENINILKKGFLHTWKVIKDVENIYDEKLIQVEETRRGIKTLLINRGGRKTYFHSKYNPIREAEAIISEYEDIEDDTTVIFYGTGLGYHIDLLLNRYPNINYYIYEPIPELLYTYLANKSMTELPSKNLVDIVVGEKEKEIVKFLNNLIEKNRGNVLLVELPIHKKVFPDEYNKFLDLFKKTVENKRSGIHTNYAFQKRWVINSMKNFGEVLSTPNIIMGDKERFKNKPAILVAAGPSLNEEIENLRYIKEKGLAYIFSVGSAINTLIYHDIYPDAACTYDPTPKNQVVFTKVKEQGISNIPMIFGSSVDYETLMDYPGKKYHMITSQDIVANYFLKTKNKKKLDVVLDAPSIAVVTMQLLYTLGFNPVILVGQNLAYKDKMRHSEGIDYSKEVTKEEQLKGIWVKDVCDNEVLTNKGFNSMRKQMELYIKEFSTMKVINTTKGGAQIEGTTFLELDKVIDKYLNEEVYDKNWLEEIETKYDTEYLKLQLKKMDRSYEKALSLINSYYNKLSKIENLINNRNFNQVEKMYVKLDETFGKIERNDFFKTFVLPMNRVEYKILANSIDSFNEEKNPTIKGRRIVDNYKRFMTRCNNDIEMMKSFYQDMRNVIMSYEG